jgi:hypothetical protein
MANAYNYSNVAQQTTLSGSISSGATSINVAVTTGFPPTTPYVLALDYGAATEELVVVTAVAGTTLTVTRAFSGTSAQSHSLGAVVRHVYNAQDATDFRTHEASTGAVHGLSGSIVGTSDTQTLSNKTLTAPTINAGALSGTFTGSPILSGAPTFSGNVTHSGEIILSNLLRGSRATATDSQYESRVTSDANARWFTQADGKTWWGPGNAAVDTNLFRAGSNTLQTDDQFRSARPNGTDVTWISQRSADSGARWYMTADGVATFGDGAGLMDTNLYRSAADTLKTDDSLVVAGGLTVGGIGQRLSARKTADTTITSNTTPSADPHLTVAVVANAVYEIEGVLFATSASTTPDITLSINGPTSSAGWWSTVAATFGSTADPDTVRVVASAIGSIRAYGIPVGGSVFGMPIFGMVETAGTAGDVSVQWSQNTSSATGTTLKIYSWIRLIRVA